MCDKLEALIDSKAAEIFADVKENAGCAFESYHRPQDTTTRQKKIYV